MTKDFFFYPVSANDITLICKGNDYILSSIFHKVLFYNFPNYIQTNTSIEDLVGTVFVIFIDVILLVVVLCV